MLRCYLPNDGRGFVYDLGHLMLSGPNEAKERPDRAGPGPMKLSTGLDATHRVVPARSGGFSRWSYAGRYRKNAIFCTGGDAPKCE